MRRSVKTVHSDTHIHDNNKLKIKLKESVLRCSVVQVNRACLVAGNFIFQQHDDAADSEMILHTRITTASERERGSEKITLHA